MAVRVYNSDVEITGVTTITGSLAVDNIQVNGNSIISGNANGDINIIPNGTGNVIIGNFAFNADQTVGAGQDNYVLTYDNSTGLINLEAAAGGGMTSFTLQGDSGSNVMVDGDTIDIQGGYGIVSSVSTLSTTSTVNLDLDFNEVTATTALLSSDYIMVQDVSEETYTRKILPGNIKMSLFDDDVIKTKSFTLKDPTSSDNIPLWITDTDITITKVMGYVRHTSFSGSVTFNITHGSSINATTPDLWGSDQSLSSQSVTTMSTSFSDETVDAGSGIKFMASGVTTCNMICITIYYKYT